MRLGAGIARALHGGEPPCVGPLSADDALSGGRVRRCPRRSYRVVGMAVPAGRARARGFRPRAPPGGRRRSRFVGADGRRRAAEWRWPREPAVARRALAPDWAGRTHSAAPVQDSADAPLAHARLALPQPDLAERRQPASDDRRNVGGIEERVPAGGIGSPACLDRRIRGAAPARRGLDTELRSRARATPYGRRRPAVPGGGEARYRAAWLRGS